MKQKFGAVIFATWAACTPVHAHDDHSASQVLARVETAQASGDIVQMQLVVRNGAGHAVTLEGIDVAGAVVQGDLPQSVAANANLVVPMTLQFEAAAPGIFSAVLDFGPEGTGPVLVTPDIQ